MIKHIIRGAFLVCFWEYLRNVVAKFLRFLYKRKLSTYKNGESNTGLLTSIKVDRENYCNAEVNDVNWDNWDENVAKGDKNLNEGEEGLELFKDMEPVIDKAKVIHVKKTFKVPKQESSPMQYSNVYYSNVNGLNLKPKYQVASELGVLDDDADGWGNEIDESYISKETETIIQNNKLMERERRVVEQKKRKLERDLLRSQKKPDMSIGIKIS